jgi:REP element-mobilizing transposase RayT
MVLRSSQATGDWSFLHPDNRDKVGRTIRQFCDRYGVKLYMLAVSYNHIHFQIRVTNRHVWKRFIRGLTAALVMTVTGANKFRELKQSFWDARPWTRVMDWGRAFP